MSYSLYAPDRSPATDYTMLLAALMDGPTRPGRTHDAGLRAYRLLGIVVAAVLLVWGGVYGPLLGGDGWSAEAAGAGAVLAVLGASYPSDFVRRRLAGGVRLLCYLVAAWLVMRVVEAAFAPEHVVGLLCVVPGIGVVYSVSLRRAWPLACYFAAAFVAVVAGLSGTPAPGVAPVLVAAAFATLSGTTLLAAGARLQVQRRFVDSEARYRAVVEEASDGIFVLDAATLHFLDVNPACCQMLGYTLAELQERTLVELVVADEHGGCAACDPGWRSAVAERRLRRKDGTTVCAELHVDRFVCRGREALSVVVHDVTTRRQREASLVAAKEKAEDIARLRSSLLTNMSHEIRTPLSSILGWSAVLAEEVGPAQRELVALIEQSGRRLHNTLDAVLELAHLDGRGRHLRPAVVDVGEVVEEVLEAWTGQAARKGIVLRFEHPAARVRAKLDEACLRRILMHLVDNAVKFTEAGSVSVTVEAGRKDLRIRVRDTGIGIGAAFLPHLFEEFRQESEGLSRNHEGNGLGLALTQRLAALLGGHVGVETEKGAGSCFTVYLPGVRVAGGVAGGADAGLAAVA